MTARDDTMTAGTNHQRTNQTSEPQVKKLPTVIDKSKWQADSDNPVCHGCRAPFNLTRRRHHCRCCGHVYCVECAPAAGSRKPLEGYQNNAIFSERSCDSCYNEFIVQMTGEFRIETNSDFTADKPRLLPGETSLKIRQLALSDYDKSFLNLLGQLTVVGDISNEEFTKRFFELKSLGKSHFTAVIEDLEAKKIIASATVIVEKKFVHDCGLCGHVEDVVVNTDYRGKQLGRRIVDYVVEYAKQMGCYKVILDCGEHNVPFYDKLGFHNKECQMVKYFS